MKVLNKIFYGFFLVLVSAFLIMPTMVSAEDPNASQGFVPCGSFSDNPCQLTDLFNLVIIVTNFMIDMAGIIAVFVIVFAGYSLVVAAGNAEAVTSAKKLLVNAVIGFFLVLAAFSITNFLIFGGRLLPNGKPLIVGNPTLNGTPAGIFRCPIDYILGNATCDGTKTGDNNGNSNGNNNAPGNGDVD